MHHATPLITTIVAGLGLAFIFGLVAQRLRLPLIAGYLLAGMVIGPFTPGYVANQALASELAELGVILLMFGVGLHFSMKELMSVKSIAIPGALAQIAVATAAGTATGLLMGWGLGAGLIFGLALSVASTVVLLRALQERDLVQTERGRIAVGCDADLILVDFTRPNLIPCHDVVSNLVYAAHGCDVAMNMCRGKVIYRNGEFLTIDMAFIKQELEQYVLPLLFH